VVDAGRAARGGAVVTKAAAGQGKRWHDLHQRYMSDVATADLLTVRCQDLGQGYGSGQG